MISGRKKILLLFLILFLLYIPVLLSALLFGAYTLPLHALFSFSADGETVLLLKMRLLRVAAAFFAGGSLALAGSVYQAVLRNPLAEPYILGVSSGASLGVALAFVTGAAAYSIYAVPGFAAAGALLILAGVLLFGAAGKSRESLLLAGVIAGTVSSGILITLVSFARSSQMSSIFWFLLGDLSAVDPVLFRFFALFSPGIALLLFLLAPKCNALALGDEYAWSIGVEPLKTNLLATSLASLLAAFCAALTGIIGFAGLIVPHIIRKSGFYDNRILFPASFFAGGLFLIFCDLLSRSIFSRQEIPLGVITSLLGGPLFLWILLHQSAYKLNR